MQKTRAIIAAIGAATAGATAGPVDVQYTVSGGPGAWVLDFAVTNNLNPADMDVYFFGVSLETGRNIAGSPDGYDPDVWTSQNNADKGGSDNTYNNVWIDSFQWDLLLPGQTLSGFRTVYSGATAPAEVPFFAYGFNWTGGEYDGSEGDYFNTAGNPGVEGLATAVPAPAALSLLALGGLTSTRRRR